MFIKESDLFPGRYVACKYDHLWYFEVITSIDKVEGDGEGEGGR